MADIAAFLGVLGLGYAANKLTGKKTEGFTDSTKTVAPGTDRTPPGVPTVPGKPRTPRYLSSGGYDQLFQLPAGGSLPSEPHPNKRGGPLHFPVPAPSLPTQQAPPAVTQEALQLRPNSWEDATPRAMFVSPLTGIEFKPGEFKHANMVPFAKKFTQPLGDSAYSQTLDDYTGAGTTQFAKREQAPLFEPTNEPMGNPYGFESTTDFMESRMVESRNRANERPVESIRVGPGLNQGFTHLPSGGFQQQAGEEYVQARMPRTDDLRVATNPKLTYSAPVVKGAHYITTGGTAETVGQVSKYLPDKFYLNKDGERNFVTTGADLKATTRSTQVLKHTTRPETSKSYAGGAGQAEGKATYTVGSTRTPLAKQMGSWGYRNADLSSLFNKDVDAGQNDYGKSGVEIRPNERFYTGTRVHATNLAPDAREGELHLQDDARATRAEELIDNPRAAGNFNALGGGLAEKATAYDPNDIARTTIKETTIDNDWLGMAAPADAQPKLTVYDPNDVARTTVKETTIDNDWLGMAAPVEAQPRMTVYDPNDTARTTIKETTIDNDYIGVAAGSANAAQKLTVYDPDDIARITGRNTLADWDLYRNMGRNGTAEGAEIRLQDKVRNTQKAAISAKSSWTGTANSFAKADMNQDSARAMRHYAQRENIAKGRKQMGSSVKLFNGEDNINMQYRRIVADSVNDREPGLDRVTAEAATANLIGAQRPRAILKLDVSAVRNEPVVVSSLESNPYVIPLHKVAAVGGKNAI
jgi:hypothetical protein